MPDYRKVRVVVSQDLDMPLAPSSPEQIQDPLTGMKSPDGEGRS